MTELKLIYTPQVTLLKSILVAESISKLVSLTRLHGNCPDQRLVGGRLCHVLTVTYFT